MSLTRPLSKLDYYSVVKGYGMMKPSPMRIYRPGFKIFERPPHLVAIIVLPLAKHSHKLSLVVH